MSVPQQSAPISPADDVHSENSDIKTLQIAQFLEVRDLEDPEISEKLNFISSKVDGIEDLMQIGSRSEDKSLEGIYTHIKFNQMEDAIADEDRKIKDKLDKKMEQQRIKNLERKRYEQKLERRRKIYRLNKIIEAEDRENRRILSEKKAFDRLQHRARINRLEADFRINNLRNAN